MSYKDLRDWLEIVDGFGELKVIEGAHWDHEIGIIRYMARKKGCDAPAVLFDNIRDYPKGYRVLTGMTNTKKRLALTLGVEEKEKDVEYVRAIYDKLKHLKPTPPRVVTRGPILENVHRGDDINLFEFPAPKWHKEDAARYIGTYCFTLTRDPEEGWVNLGTYRTMIHDKDTLLTFTEPGQHRTIHMEKYFARKEPMPVALCFGADPLLVHVAGHEFLWGVSEYDMAGGIKGEAIEVIEGEVTGLPIPARAEIIVEGLTLPDQKLPEGLYAESTGYYGASTHQEPVIKVKSVMHRNNPIITGLPTGSSPKRMIAGEALAGIDSSSFIRSAQIWQQMEAAGVLDIRGVWSHPAGGHRMITIVSIKQRYPGHVAQAGLIASQCQAGNYQGRYVIVVDHDIDPTNDFAVLWALSMRSDPIESIDIVKRSRTGYRDIAVSVENIGKVNSRAIIDACIPFDRIKEFGEKKATFDPEARRAVLKRYGNSLLE